MTVRLSKNDRKKQILGMALEQAKTCGYQNITRERLSAALGVSTGLINQQFGTMAQLKRAVIRAAISQQVLEVVAQGLVAKDPHASKAPDALKKQALSSLAL